MYQKKQERKLAKEPREEKELYLLLVCTGIQMALMIFLPMIVQNGITKAEQIMWLDSEMKKVNGYMITPR